MAEIPSDYRKDFDYLKGLSSKGVLRHDNSILQKLENAARNLPGLRSALGTLRIQY